MNAKTTVIALSVSMMMGAAPAAVAAEAVVPVPRPDRQAEAQDAERDYVGAKVVTSDNRVSGEVEEIVDQDGTLKAVIGYGGLLGLGDARVAMPLTDLTLVSAGIARVRISDAQIKRLPKYKG